jgi:hypothetical protein
MGWTSSRPAPELKKQQKRHNRYKGIADTLEDLLRLAHMRYRGGVDTRSMRSTPIATFFKRSSTWHKSAWRNF